MTEENSETKIIENLRSKAGETDIRQYLRSTLGGYTKRSVHEYISFLRKQQQSTADTFFRNQQVLFEEKENLRKMSEALKTKLAKIEEEYRGLTDTKKIDELESEALTPDDIAALKNRAALLEAELEKSAGEKSLLEKQLGLRESALEDMKRELERAQQEKQPLKELIRSQTRKEKELNLEILRLTETAGERDEEIKFLKASLSEGRTAELNEKVGELTEQLSMQSEMIAALNCELELRQKDAEALSGENETLKRRAAEFKKNIQELNGRNEKLSAECRALTEQLEIEYKRSIDLIKARSDATMARLETERKLGEAGSKLTLMELELKKRSAPDNTVEAAGTDGPDEKSAEQDN